MEQQPSSGQNRREYHYKSKVWGGGLFVGTVLIILGLYFIGREMGWLPHGFPFWAVIIIAAGIFMVTGALRQRPK